MENLFINREIFDADADYIIGGFYTDNTELKYLDFADELKDKLTDLVDDYLDRANNVNREIGYKEDSFAKANENLGLLLKDNLDILVPYTQTEIVVNEILSHPKVGKWLFKINIGIEDSQSLLQKTNLNKFETASDKEKEIAEYFTNTTLEKWIEAISTTIEL